MMSVLLIGDDIDIENLCRIANELQKYYRFEPYSDAAIHPLCVSLDITSLSLMRLAKVSLDEGIKITTSQKDGICGYADISTDYYLLLCAFIGLVQWRALDLNPLTKPEDFIHKDDSNCLFVPRDTMQEYSHNIEKLYLCSGCADFYHCLGSDSELVMLYIMLDFLRSEKRKRAHCNHD